MFTVINTTISASETVSSYIKEGYSCYFFSMDSFVQQRNKIRTYKGLFYNLDSVSYSYEHEVNSNYSLICGILELKDLNFAKLTPFNSFIFITKDSADISEAFFQKILSSLELDKDEMVFLNLELIMKINPEIDVSLRAVFDPDASLSGILKVEKLERLNQ